MSATVCMCRNCSRAACPMPHLGFPETKTEIATQELLDEIGSCYLWEPANEATAAFRWITRKEDSVDRAIWQMNEWFEESGIPVTFKRKGRA